MHSHSVKNSQKGQVLLLVVLASVIALTVGLAAISRSITSTRISTEESNSQKALSAAEAGIEEQINKALSGNAEDTPISETFNNNSGFISQAEEVKPFGGRAFEVNNGDTVPQDEGADIWLSDQDFSTPITSTQLTIYWNGNGNCAVNAANVEPAIEVAIIYGARDNPSMRRYAADFCRETRGNNFTRIYNSSNNVDGVPYNRRYVLPDTILRGYIARVIPLYASTKIGAQSSAPLPVQGYVIESTGESGDTVRKLRVFQGLPKLPIEFFPYNLFLP